jgi:hypothetical protein
MNSISMDSLHEPLLNIGKTIDGYEKEDDVMIYDEKYQKEDEKDDEKDDENMIQYNQIIDENLSAYYEKATINYSSHIPDGTIIHYMKENNRYCGCVLYDRVYGPCNRNHFNQLGYLHLTMIQFENGQTDHLYYEIYQSNCIEMKDYNCIILNPLTES